MTPPTSIIIFIFIFAVVSLISLNEDVQQETSPKKQNKTKQKFLCFNKRLESLLLKEP